MRKLLIILFAVIATMSILWIFAGRQISEFVDRFAITEGQSRSVHSISYQGTGEGGEFEIHLPPGRLNLSLVPLSPHIGSDKENQLALANAGKVFALGPLHSADNDNFAAEVPNDDTALVKFDHGFLPWPDFTRSKAAYFVVWRRHWYAQLVWTKANGATLKMLWRSKGLADEMLGQGIVFDDSSLLPAPEITDLIRIEISDASR